MRKQNDLKNGSLEKTLSEFKRECRRKKLRAHDRERFLILTEKINNELDNMDKDLKRVDVIYSCKSYYSFMIDMESIVFGLGILAYFASLIVDEMIEVEMFKMSILFLNVCILIYMIIVVPQYKFLLKVLEKIEEE